MDLTLSALSGINAAESRLNTAASRLTTGAAAPSSAGDVDTADLSATAVALIQARTEVAFSVKVAHAAQDLQKSLFDLIA